MRKGTQAENVDIIHQLREKEDLWIYEDLENMSSTHLNDKDSCKKKPYVGRNLNISEDIEKEKWQAINFKIFIN